MIGARGDGRRVAVEVTSCGSPNCRSRTRSGCCSASRRRGRSEPSGRSSANAAPPQYLQGQPAVGLHAHERWPSAGSCSSWWGGSKRWPTSACAMCRCRGMSSSSTFRRGCSSEKPFFDFLMDLLLLFVLSGVALAWAKRFLLEEDGNAPHDPTCAGRPHCAFGPVVRIPARLDRRKHHLRPLWHGGGFLTGSLGGWMAAHMSTFVLINLESVAWWFYSSRSVSSSWRCRSPATCTSSRRYP